MERAEIYYKRIRILLLLFELIVLCSTVYPFSYFNSTSITLRAAEFMGFGKTL
jgi:hypothetical protein